MSKKQMSEKETSGKCSLLVCFHYLICEYAVEDGFEASKLSYSFESIVLVNHCLSTFP